MAPEFRREIKAVLRDLIASETDSARAHYARFNRKKRTYDFSDKIWREAHEASFNIVARARAVLEKL